MKADLWDLIAIVGAAMLAYGCHLIYPPSAFVAGGIMLLVLGIRGSASTPVAPSRTEIEGG